MTNVNFEFIQTETDIKTVTVTKNRELMDLTGYIAVMQFIHTQTCIVTTSIDGDISVPTSGVIVFNVTPEDTDIKPDIYEVRVMLYNESTQDRKYPITGQVNIIKNYE